MGEIKFALGGVERLRQGLEALVKIENLLPGTAYRVFKLDKKIGEAYQQFIKQRNDILDKYGAYSVAIADKGTYVLDKTAQPPVWKNGSEELTEIPKEYLPLVIWTAKDDQAMAAANTELKSLTETEEVISEPAIKLSLLKTVGKNGERLDVAMSPILAAMLDELIEDDLA